MCLVNWNWSDQKEKNKLIKFRIFEQKLNNSRKWIDFWEKRFTTNIDGISKIIFLIEIPSEHRLHHLMYVFNFIIWNEDKSII